MRNSFSWRHAFALLAVVCLLSIVAGAVLAQDEPELPAPDVPVFDLSGTGVEPSEPDSAPAMNPFVVIEPAVITTAPGNLVPADGSVVPTNQVSFTFDAVTGATDYDLWVFNGYQDPYTGDVIPMTYTGPLTSTTIDVTSLQVAVAGGTFALQDGQFYVWQVRANDADGPGPWAQAAFYVDVPWDGTPLTSTIVTTPLITWPASTEPDADWYNLIAVGYELNDAGARTGNYVVGWNGWYPTVDKSYPTLGMDFEGICENEQCKIRPETELTQDIYTGAVLVGNVEVDIYYRWLDEGTGVISDWVVTAPLISFEILSPEVSVEVDVDNVAILDGEARPGFTVERSSQDANEMLPWVVDVWGFTQTVYPDYYEIYVLNNDTFALESHQWFDVANGSPTSMCWDENYDPTTVCVLEAYGLQDLLYNGDHLYAVRGYSTVLDAFTPYALGVTNDGVFTVDEAAPTAASAVALGAYERLGYDNDWAQPWAMTSTWVPCAAGTAPLDYECDTVRPWFHIDINEDGYSGDWIAVAIVNDDFSYVYYNWFNIYSSSGLSVLSSDDDGWDCGWGFGYGEFDEVTCFVRPDADSPLSFGENYTMYIGSYGPGSTLTNFFNSFDADLTFGNR